MGYSRMILALNMGVTKLRSRSNFRREKVHRDLHLDLDRFVVELPVLECVRFARAKGTRALLCR